MTSPNPETTSSTENGVAATTEVEAYGDATVSSGYSATSHIHDMAKTQSTVADGMTSASIPVAKEDSINPKKRPLSPELDSISSAAPTTVMSNAVVSTNRESDASKTGPRLASLATPVLQQQCHASLFKMTHQPNAHHRSIRPMQVSQSMHSMGLPPTVISQQQQQ
ncbi:hypothetical protein BSLG_009873 [Batrachochytrium salamandrivorans]|nr:hypothetical protein BSLG_009873 [Batrachochytrium salamandrivorans]